MTLRRVSLLLLCTFAAVTAGCGKREPAPDHDHAAHGGHVHTAPHGGVLVEIGEHAYNLEFVRDPAAGKLTAYVLDGHAENFIRLNAPTLEIVAITADGKHPLTLRAVANAATGETVGDTSQFDASADWLKSAGALELAIPSLTIRGGAFSNVRAKVPAARAAAHAH